MKISTMDRHPCTGKDHAKFTLIELLVVTAILAILAGMLLPSLSRVKAIAKMTGCSSNLKQFGMMIANYTNSYGGYLPGGTSFDGGPEKYWPDWLEVPMAASRDLLCPAETAGIHSAYKKAKPQPYAPYYKMLIFHYCANGSGTTLGHTGFKAVMGRNWGSMMHVEKVKKPSRTFCMTDANVNKWTPFITTAKSSRMALIMDCFADLAKVNRDVSYRHPDTSMNFLFVDGHALNLTLNTIVNDSNAFAVAPHHVGVTSFFLAWE